MHIEIYAVFCITNFHQSTIYVNTLCLENIHKYQIFDHKNWKTPTIYSCWKCFSTSFEKDENSVISISRKKTQKVHTIEKYHQIWLHKKFIFDLSKQIKFWHPPWGGIWKKFRRKKWIRYPYEKLRKYRRYYISNLDYKKHR